MDEIYRSDIMTEPTERVIDADNPQIINWSELWSYKELFYFFTWRDIKIRYKQTVLGFLWAILQPFIMMVIYTLFFGRALKIPEQQLPYPVFVFSGLLLWMMFSSGLSSAANSMINNASIIKKIYFPRIIIPTSALLVALFDFFMALILFVALLAYYRLIPGIEALWCWPLAIIVTLASTLGPGSLLAALNIKYRDFRYVIPFLIQILFFLTPILYPIYFLEEGPLRYVLACNPMYAAIELFRFPLVAGSTLPFNYMAISLMSCFLFFITGILYFKRTEEFFADLA